MMNARNRNLLVGLFALALCGSALAHEPGAHGSYPSGNWSGSATRLGRFTGLLRVVRQSEFRHRVWIRARLRSWWPSVFRRGHRHGPSCHHARRTAMRILPKGNKHGQKHGHRHGHEHPGHH